MKTDLRVNRTETTAAIYCSVFRSELRPTVLNPAGFNTPCALVGQGAQNVVKDNSVVAQFFK